MTYDIYVEAINKQNYVALLGGRSNRLEDVFLEHPARYDLHNPKWAAIYYARVEKIDPNLNAAFIDLGDGMKALLHAKHLYVPQDDTKKAKLPSMMPKKNISNLLQAGDWLFVQVKAEGYLDTEDSLKKLPRVTSKIMIAGRSLLYSPNVLGISSCHWVSKEEEEITGEKLIKEHDKGGWIIRQMAPDLPDDILYLEAESLISMWKRAKKRAREARDTKTPKCVMRAPNAIERALIDYSRRGIKSFECMTNEQLKTAKEWAERFAPDLAAKMRLAEFNPQDKVKSIFEAYDIHQMIDALKDDIVELPSGGNIVIEECCACTVIDINTGSANSFDTNMEAATEIMRQIRARNLSGIIICDVINETSKNKRTQILNNFEHACQHDPADPQIHGFTRLMMCEITRRRRTTSIASESELELKAEFPSM